MRLNYSLNKTFSILDFKTLEDGELRTGTVAGSAFQTVGAAQWKARFTSSVCVEGTCSNSSTPDMPPEILQHVRIACHAERCRPTIAMIHSVCLSHAGIVLKRLMPYDYAVFTGGYRHDSSLVCFDRFRFGDKNVTN